MPSAVVQWTIDQLFGQLRRIRDGAAAERSRISMNNARLMDLNREADEIGDAARRQQFKAWIQRSVSRQGEIANLYRSTSAKISALADRIRSFLLQHGIAPSAAGLSDLGVVPPLVVPAALIALAAVSWAAVAFIHERNAVQTRMIDLHARGLNELIRGGASPQQIAQFIAEADAGLARAKPSNDPFGLESLLPIALVAVGLVVFGPQLLRALRGRRA